MKLPGWLVAGLVGLLLLWLGSMVFYQRALSRWEQERQRLEAAGRFYRDTTSAIRDTLRASLQRIDSLRAARRDTIVPIRIIRRLDTLRLVVGDTAQTDSLRLVAAQRSLELQDTIMAAQSRRIATLEDLVQQDSMAIVLFQRQRGMDSTRVVVLEDLIKRAPTRGCRLPLIGLPCPKLGIGYAGTWADGKLRQGPAIAVIIPIL